MAQGSDGRNEMREILFRGKRTDNGKWVYGVPVIGITSGVFMVWIEPETKRGRGKLSIRDVVKQAEVIPETVGQYTGLKDKNGKEIFEGDVMHWDSHWGWYVGYENGAFRRIPLNDIQRTNWKHYTLQQEGLDTWEIIGNIHGNPELLDSQKKQAL